MRPVPNRDRLRQSVVADLHAMLTDERTQMRKSAQLRRILGVVAVVLLTVVLVTVDEYPWVAVACGAVAGALAGVSASLAGSMQRWPVLRTYLDVSRVEDDYREQERDAAGSEG